MSRKYGESFGGSARMGRAKSTPLANKYPRSAQQRCKQCKQEPIKEWTAMSGKRDFSGRRHHGYGRSSERLAFCQSFLNHFLGGDKCRAPTTPRPRFKKDHDRQPGRDRIREREPCLATDVSFELHMRRSFSVILIAQRDHDVFLWQRTSVLAIDDANCYHLAKGNGTDPQQTQAR
jgi:hypothetical protein